MYGTGAAIGFSPQQVNEMSIWQFNAAVKGYAAANSSQEKGKFSSAEEMDEAFEFAMSDQGRKILTSNNIYIWDGIKFHLERTVSFWADEIKKPRPVNPEKEELIRQKRLEQQSGSFQ